MSAEFSGCLMGSPGPLVSAGFPLGSQVGSLHSELSTLSLCLRPLLFHDHAPEFKVILEQIFAQRSVTQLTLVIKAATRLKLQSTARWQSRSAFQPPRLGSLKQGCDWPAAQRVD